MAGIRSTNMVFRAQDSPAAGAYVVIPFQWTTMTTSTAHTRDFELPAGMKMKVVGATVNARAVSDAPSLQIGSYATAAKYVAAVNVTTSLGALTMVSANQETAAGEIVRVTVTNNSTAFANDLCVNVVGFITAHPTAAPGS